MLQTEQLLAFLLEHLKAVVDQRGQLQFAICLSGVEAIAKERCSDRVANAARLSDEEGARLKHVIWDLILERVLVPGTCDPRSSNDGWPFLSITDHGRKVIKEQRPVPYDPDGYLERLRKSTGGLHGTVEAYLAEAVSTFRTGNTMASAVMLGAASEMVFTELCEAIALAFSDENQQKTFEGKTGQKRNMVDRVRAVSDWLSKYKAGLPDDWKKPERHRLIQNVADLIRNRRNETGHPQDPPFKPSHEEMYALLMLFPEYCENLYSLKTWLAANRGAIGSLIPHPDGIKK